MNVRWHIFSLSETFSNVSLNIEPVLFPSLQKKVNSPPQQKPSFRVSEAIVCWEFEIGSVTYGKCPSALLSQEVQTRTQCFTQKAAPVPHVLQTDELHCHSCSCSSQKAGEFSYLFLNPKYTFFIKSCHFHFLNVFFQDLLLGSSFLSSGYLRL